MFTGPQVVEALIGFVVMLATVWGVVSTMMHTLTTDLAKSQDTLKEDLQSAINEVKTAHTKSVDESRQAHAKSVDESRQQFTAINENVAKLSGQITTIMEGYISDLQRRVARLESGQDDWTKELRERTHALGKEIDKHGFELELIKRELPRGPKP